MERIRGRWDNVVSLGPDATLTLPEMDEALLRLPGLIDYRATVSKARQGVFQLTIDAHRAEGEGPTEHDILQALNQVGAVRKGIANGRLGTPAIRFSQERPWSTTGVSKRRILTMWDPAV
jgi:hypothetical protein